jgi:prolyl oligopeptidase
MTQRPELMKVALPAVELMDMLRYHTFYGQDGLMIVSTSEDNEKYRLPILPCKM